jgi:hypothetical protein
MPTAVEFMQKYRNLSVGYVEDTGSMCREAKATIQLKTYFMMNWTEGTDQRTDFNLVTSGGRNNDWFRQHRQQILNAAMGKGAPRDYELALEWAVASGKISQPSPANIQNFCDQRLGIDCSGFVTNFLIANSLRPSLPATASNTSAASYFVDSQAVNNIYDIQPGHLLVWMEGNQVKRNPGHVAVVDFYIPQSLPGGNMRVVEATGAAGANPKLLDSMYAVDEIIEPRGSVPMILVVTRHGISGSRVAVMRP